MGPIRGQTRPLPVAADIVPEVQHIDAKLDASIHNRFDVEVIDSVTGEVRQRAQAENVICNQLWTRLFTPANYFNYIHYGSGSGTPSASNTSLFTFVGAIGAGDETYSSSKGVMSLRKKIQLSESTAAGITITEVGIGYSDTASTLCTHAMLMDMNGNPISIAKTSTDIINIYATVYLHFSTLAQNGVLLHPNSYFMKYLLGTYYYSSDSQDRKIPPILIGVSCANTYIPYTYALTQKYNSTSKTITLTASRIGASDANIHGIYGLLLYTYAKASYNGNNYLNPALFCGLDSSWYAGTDITAEAIGTGDGSKVDFSTVFQVDSGFKLYVDGVETSAYTVDTGKPPVLSDMGRYFIGLSPDSTDANHILEIDLCAPSSLCDVSRTGIFYNPYYALGIKSYTNQYCSIKISNDLITWVDLTYGSGTYTIPEAYRNYKYFKTSTEYNTAYCRLFTANVDNTANVHFTVAPANGAVITADYRTNCIAKDANHVFDFSCTIQLGEHTT